MRTVRDNRRRRRACALLAVALPCCAGFILPKSATVSSGVHTRARLLLQPLRASGDDDEEENGAADDDAADEPEGYTWEELQADPELRQLEFESAVSRRNNMLLPQRISAAVTTLGWLFVGGGIILNSLGYAWVKDPSGGIGIGTLDERDFQKEVMREKRKGLDENKEATLSKAMGGIANEYIARWADQEGIANNEHLS
ncbi:hypothetical protein ACHAXT_008687 [Thalassiosira profunda]